jgi:integrase
VGHGGRSPAAFLRDQDKAHAKAEVAEWATPHDLRHYFASALIRSGASVKVVQARLGHASAKTTLDVYGHLFPDEEDRTRAAIDAELGTPRVLDVS